MIRNTLLASVGALALGAAATGDEPGQYVGLSAGLGAIEDLDVTFDANPAAKVEFDGESNSVESLTWGYKYGNGWRTELEATHRFNDLGAFSDTTGDSSAQDWSLMGNAIYDFNSDGVLKPYLGAGIGASHIDYTAEGYVLGVYTDVHDKDTSWAAQGLAGVAWQVAPRWELDAGYRYFVQQDADFDGAHFNSAYEHHDVMLGVRYQFGRTETAVAAPPAPPTRAPATPRAQVCDDVEFVVYFEWDESDLTDQAEATIQSAADQADDCSVTRVNVEGHADRSGSAAYNAQLSQRRAATVRDALIRAGVPATVIAIEAKGESDPAVDTPDGVREPLNRRSTVLIVLGDGETS